MLAEEREAAPSSSSSKYMSCVFSMSGSMSSAGKLVNCNSLNRRRMTSALGSRFIAGLNVKIGPKAQVILGLIWASGISKP